MPSIFPALKLEGYEADDVLGSVARQAVAQGYGVKIITGDRDLLQLVNDRILVNLPGKSICRGQRLPPCGCKGLPGRAPRPGG